MRKALYMFVLIFSCMFVLTGCDDEVSNDNNQGSSNGNNQNNGSNNSDPTIVYDIIYELNGGENNLDNPEEYTIESEFILKDASKEYYDFLGWYTDSNFQNPITRVYNMSGNFVLYAKWEITTYDITYVYDGGDEIKENPTSHTIDLSDVELINPSKEKSIITSWCLDKELTIDIKYLDKEALSYAIDKNITLYAKYQTVYDIIFTDVDSYGVERNYVYFGSYPQTVEADYATLVSLRKLTEVNENGFYELNGVEYAKKTNTSSATRYWNNGSLLYRNYDYFFKVEPIKWRVLESDGAVQVVSENILDIVYYFSLTYDAIEKDGQTIYPNNYEHSNIRDVLYNETFVDYFNEFEQQFVATTLVDNSTTGAPDANDFASNDTYDKLYLLSYQDLCNENFGFDSVPTILNGVKSQNAIVTDYAMINGVTKTSGKYGSWLLRSPYSSTSGNQGSYVYMSIPTYGLHSGIAYYGSSQGLRPAFTFE